MLVSTFPSTHFSWKGYNEAARNDPGVLFSELTLKNSNGTSVESSQQIQPVCHFIPTILQPFQWSSFHKAASTIFLSSAVLLDPEHIPNHHDEQESAFYLFVYHLLRYTKHNQLHNMDSYMDMFDTADEDISLRTIGKLKWHFLKIGVNDLVFDGRPLLTKLIKDLALMFSVRYESPPDGALLDFFKSEAGAQSSANPIIRMQKLDRWFWVDALREYLDSEEFRQPEHDLAVWSRIAVLARNGGDLGESVWISVGFLLYELLITLIRWSSLSFEKILAGHVIVAIW